VADIVPGDLNEFASSLVSLGTTLFFQIDRGGQQEWWCSDGSADGTSLVSVLDLARSDANPRKMVDLADKLLFVADDGVHGDQLWRSDGSAEGTTAFSQETPYSGDDRLERLITQPHVAFFRSATGIWRTDGTSEGTFPLASLPHLEGIAFGERSIFFIENAAPTYILWHSDGTPEGTQPVMTLSGFGDALSYNLAVAGDLAFFTTNDGSLTWLWRSDGSVAGTYAIKQVSRLRVVPFKGQFFFLGWSGGQHSLWRTDGTEAGTTPVVATGSQASDLVATNDMLYFTDGTTPGKRALWASDGTASGTRQVSDDAVFVFYIVPIDNTLFITASDPQHGTELWKSDETSTGIKPVTDLIPGPGSGLGLSQPIDIGGKLVFVTTDGVHGMEPWISDGTAPGTRMLADLAPGIANSNPIAFGLQGSTLFVSADDGRSGTELWARQLGESSQMLLPTVLK